MDNSIKKLTMIALMSAVVFVTSAYIQIPIPTIFGMTRIHLGNAFCLLAGFLLGPITGGLASGIGSALFDITSPIYITSTPFTFVFKFLLAFIAGFISKKYNGKYILLISASIASLSYIFLYLSKEFLKQVFIYQIEMEVILFGVGKIALIQMFLSSFINGIFAVIISLSLYKILKGYSIK